MRLAVVGLASCTILGLAVVGIARTSGGAMYNSEEHKLIGDRGAGKVKIPASVSAALPASVKLEAADRATYIAGMTNAKILAVGYGVNGDIWSDSLYKAAQDNCYFTGKLRATNSFGQGEYNVKLWIPDVSDAPTTLLRIDGYASARGQARSFTFGELVALYGDYRVAPYCDGTKCLLTDGNVDTLRFVAQGLTSEKYCPNTMSLTHYLSYVGSGLIPPFGAAGNATGDTDKSSVDYADAGWWGDEMLRIAMVNEWHFSNAAVAWYIGMHRLALMYADSARQNPGYWVKALHFEANALHSLTDLFAFGHVVTNSDQASYNIVLNSQVENDSLSKWMKSVIALGGGNRDAGKIVLTSGLPELAITERPPRNTKQMVTATRAQSGYKVAEKFYHDSFNEDGARVRNLRGDDFEIYGDGDLAKMKHPRTTLISGINVAEAAVTASVQSLFDAADALAKGSSTAAELSKAPDFFAALQYIPVYIVSDHFGYFTGRWTLYADVINTLTAAGKQIDPQCQIPRITGTANDLSVLQMARVSKGGERDLLEWPPQQGPKVCAVFR